MSLIGVAPAMDPVHFGWEAEHANKSLIPSNMCQGTPYAPEQVLKLIRCGCSSEKACHGGNCGCMSHHLSCSIFCTCDGTKVCHNSFKQTTHDEDLEDEY